MKKCPYCAEEIRSDAIKCRFCGEFLEVKSETGELPKEEAHGDDWKQWVAEYSAMTGARREAHWNSLDKDQQEFVKRKFGLTPPSEAIGPNPSALAGCANIALYLVAGIFALALVALLIVKPTSKLDRPYQYAKQFISEEKYKLAFDRLEAVTKINSNFKDSRKLLRKIGEKALEKRDFDFALRVFKRLADIDPTDSDLADPLYSLGQWFLQQKDLGTALEALRSLEKVAPEYENLEDMLRRAEQQKANVDEKRRIAENKAREQAWIEANALEVVKSDWFKSGFGSVGMWRVTFENISTRPVGNILYKTTYFSETGQEVDHGGSLNGGDVIEKVIPAKGTRTLEVNDGFISRQAHRARFEVLSWEFVRDAR